MENPFKRLSASAQAGLYGAWTVLLTYNLQFFNKYFPLTEGWFSAYARLILNGKIPYRDFYLFLPPLYPLQLAAFMAIFGSHFLALRILGLGVILFMTAVLYLIYARWFPPFAACFATVIAMIYYQSGVAHIPYDFTQFMTAYALVALYLIIRHSETVPVGAGALSPESTRYLVIAGAMSACVFLIKQSNGLFIALFCVLAVFLGSARWGLQRAVKSAIPFLVGALIPVLLIVIWLACHSALSACIDQIYFDALQSKGSWGGVFEWTHHVLGLGYFITLRQVVYDAIPLVILNVVLLAASKGLWNTVSDRLWWNLFMVSLVVGMGLAGLWLPLHHALYARQKIVPTVLPWPNLVIVLSTALPIILLMWNLIMLTFRRRCAQPGLIVFATVATGFIFGNGTSAGIGEISCFLGLGLFLGWLFSFRADLLIGKAALMAVGFCFIVYLAGLKYTSPYAWWYVEQPDIRGDLVPANLPLLKGLWLSPDTLQMFQTTTAIVEKYTSPGDTIYAFPHMPIFYLLTDRWPVGKAIVSWFDFLPDAKARDEAAGLLAHPPAVILDLEMPELAWTTHERLFRQGHAMGQRDIRASIEKLTSQKGSYILEKSIPVPRDCILKIWRLRSHAHS